MCASVSVCVSFRKGVIRHTVRPIEIKTKTKYTFIALWSSFGLFILIGSVQYREHSISASLTDWLTDWTFEQTVAVKLSDAYVIHLCDLMCARACVCMWFAIVMWLKCWLLLCIFINVSLALRDDACTETFNRLNELIEGNSVPHCDHVQCALYQLNADAIYC